jgi:hypothetical protein
VRIHIFDNHRKYSDHAFYFVAEHPKLTIEEFDRLLQAWMAYQKEELREDLDRVAIVLPLELAPGLAAYPTQIHSIQEFVEHIRHSPPAGGVSEAATTAIGSLGEELVLKLSALLDDEEKAHEDLLSAAVVAAVAQAEPPTSSPAWNLFGPATGPEAVDQRLSREVKALQKALKIVDREALWAYVNGGVDGVERWVKQSRGSTTAVKSLEDENGGGR